MRYINSPSAGRKTRFTISRPFNVKKREDIPQTKPILEFIYCETEICVDSFQGGGLTTTCESRFAIVRPYRTINHGENAPKSITSREPPIRVRTSFSSHHSRPGMSTAQDGTVFATLPPPRSSPCSTSSVKTQVIKGRRSLLRKILDVGGCTKSDTLDIGDYTRSRVATPIVRHVVHKQSGSLEGPRPLRYERWRGIVFQMLYTGAGTAASTPNFSHSVRCTSNAI